MAWYRRQWFCMNLACSLARFTLLPGQREVLRVVLYARGPFRAHRGSPEECLRPQRFQNPLPHPEPHAQGQGQGTEKASRHSRRAVRSLFIL